MRSFEPNVISFTVTSGRKIWYIVGAYVPPNDLLAVHPVTYGNICVRIWDRGDGEDASRRSQCLPGKSEVPKG